MDLSGSFKVRGLVNQFANIPSEIVHNKRRLVTMSAGNYGKAFANAVKEHNFPATLCMPESAPVSRAALIEVLASTAITYYNISNLIAKTSDDALIIIRTNGLMPY